MRCAPETGAKRRICRGELQEGKMSNLQSSNYQNEARRFLTFQTTVTPVAVRVAYAIGALGVTVLGILKIVNSFRGHFSIMGLLTALFFLVVGNLAWRLACELWLAFYRACEATARRA
jgi:hypothetical protein